MRGKNPRENRTTCCFQVQWSLQTSASLTPTLFLHAKCEGPRNNEICLLKCPRVTLSHKTLYHVRSEACKTWRSWCDQTLLKSASVAPADTALLKLIQETQRLKLLLPNIRSIYIGGLYECSGHCLSLTAVSLCLRKVRTPHVSSPALTYKRCQLFFNGAR